jgi:small subunit ribosomal protein S8
MSLKTKHSVSAFVTQINNALNNNLEQIEVPYSSLIETIVLVIAKEGFVKSFTIIDNDQPKILAKSIIGNFKTSRRVLKNRQIKPNMKIFLMEQLFRIRLKSKITRPKKDTKKLLVQIKYFDNQPAICSVVGISKPSKKCYASVTSLWHFYNNNFTYLLSTNKGILTSKQALRIGLGGKLLIKVF